MLSRAAARAIRARPVSAPFRLPTTSIAARSYADKPPQNKDFRWKPSQPIDFASSKPAQPKPQKPFSKPSSKKGAEYSKDQTEYDADATPSRNTGYESRGAGPGSTQNARGTREQREFSAEQEELSGPRSSDENTAPTTERTRPSKPLPDLRQGIPSTFDAEFGGAPKSDNASDAAEDPSKEPEAAAEGAGYSGGRESGELPKSAYETSTDRRRNKVANYSYLATLLLGAVGVTYLGRNWDTEEEERIHPDAPSGWGAKLMYDRLMARINGQMGYYTEPTFPKLLPDMDPPPPYTLVISLEDMLVHSEWTREHGWRTAKRPGVDYFLRYLSQYYELVIFTSLPSQTADPVIRKLDPFRVVMWPLFREATRYEKGQYVKDLSYLNRDLSKTIIIDTKKEHAKLQPENAIILPEWKGQPGDKSLVALIPFLEHVATMGVTDVRKAIESFEDKDIATEFAKREAKAREEFNKQLAEEKAKRPKHSAGGWLMGALGLKAAASQGGLAVGEQSASEGFEQGKMLSDQIRERGMKNYQLMEEDIRKNAEKWLKEMAQEEEKMRQEQLNSMKSGMTSWFGGGKRE